MALTKRFMNFLMSLQLSEFLVVNRSESLCKASVRTGQRTRKDFVCSPQAVFKMLKISLTSSQHAVDSPLRGASSSSFTSSYATCVPAIRNLILTLCVPSNPNFVQFLLDCSCLPEVILATQQDGKEVRGHLFLITRLWVYTLHREGMKLKGMKLLGRWNYYLQMLSFPKQN